MPPLHVLGVGFQIGAGLKVGIVILRIKVLGMDETGQHHRAERAGEFPVLVIHILGDFAQTIYELLTVGCNTPLDLGAVFPRTWGIGIVSPTGTKSRKQWG
jgi:hypothetical protein